MEENTSGWTFPSKICLRTWNVKESNGVEEAIISLKAFLKKTTKRTEL